MNRHEQEALLNRIRSRVNMFHDTNNTKRHYSFKASDDSGQPSQMYLYDYIGGWDGITSKGMVQDLAALNGPLDLHINSGGGDIFEGVAIYNLLKNYNDSKGTVRSYIDGVAASAASFVALAGSEVISEANGTLMVHDGWGFTIGNEQDHLDAAGVLGMLSNTIAEMYAKKSGGSVDEWRKTMRQEMWYTAREAKTAGLVDRVVGDDSTSAENSFDLSVFTYAGRADMPGATMPVQPKAQNDDFDSIDFDGFRNALKGAFA